MDSWYGKLMTSIFILPFAAGNYRRRQNGSWYYDGATSSRVLFLAILAIVTMFSASRRIPIHAEVRLGIVLILLSLIMVSALIGSLIMGCLVQKQGLTSIVAARRNTNTLKIQVMFLWAFGMASGLYCAFFVGKLIECSVYTSGGFYGIALFCFNVLLTFCLLFQMIVITYFSSFKLKQNSFVNNVMLLHLAAIVSVIFYIYLMGDPITFLENLDNKVDLTSCLQNNTTMTFLKVELRPFLDPTIFEYGLLSATIILEIWSPTETQNPDIGSPNAGRSTSERTALLHDITPIEHLNSKNRVKKKVFQLITLAVSLTTGLGLVVCYVVMALDIGNVDSIEYVVEIYEFTLKLVMIIAIFAGFFCLVNYCTPDNPSKDLKPREYVYLLSAFGIFLMHICEGVAGDVSSDSLANLFMSTSILGIFQDYIQVVFLMYANRCKQSNPQSNVTLLESILIFTMISNFILWFNDSFLVYEFPKTRILKHGNNSDIMFEIMYKVLLPVSIFFRFTSFMEYYATFGKYTS